MHTFFCYSNYVKLALSVCESVMLSSQRKVYSNQRGSIWILIYETIKNVPRHCCHLLLFDHPADGRHEDATPDPIPKFLFSICPPSLRTSLR